MSYASGAALQAAIFEALLGDAAVAALSGGAVFDAPPAGRMPPLWIAIGAEDVRDASDATGPGAEHRLTVIVEGEAPGFSAVKALAAAASDALDGAALGLTRGRLVGLRFVRARARARGRARRVEMTFRARVQGD